MKKNLFLLSACLIINFVNAQTYIPFASTWKYLDNGSNQGTAWRSSGFADASWVSGIAPLGYGICTTNTTVSYGPSSSSKYITTYFRKSISFADASLLKDITLNIKGDNGIVVYINGVEKYRNNLTTGSVVYNTLASTAATDNAGILVKPVVLPANSFITGTNIIAVEVHQASVSSPNLLFDLELTEIPNLIPFGAAWKYLDNGTNQGTAWMSNSFSDATWATGVGQLGYGDGDEATVVSYGSNINNKFITTYFRKSFNVSDASIYSGLVLNVKRDDGIVVYLNGEEIMNDNMPSPVAYNTLALTAALDDGAAINKFAIFADKFINGTNVIAVEIHQQSIASSDLSFDLQLNAIPSYELTDIPNLIPFGAAWKYLDNGTNQGTAWRSNSFSDATWAMGITQLGYGDGDEATVVSYGSNINNKFITTYFRKSFNVPDASLYSGLVLNVKRDDGIIVYLNGQEIMNNNMPPSPVAYNTLAITAAPDDGDAIYSMTILANKFINGTNVIAVEIHQHNVASSDLSFDLQLNAIPSCTSNLSALLTRGPYLQIGTSTSEIIKWKTNTNVDSRVKYGTSPGNLTLITDDNSLTSNHEIKLINLLPNTKYYYSIGTTSGRIQGDGNNFFITAPATGVIKKTRIWVTGDCGNNSSNQVNVRDQYLSYLGTNYTDVWLLLGDNAYDKGLDGEYQNKFFDIYKDKMLKQTTLWPAPGNHDYSNNSGSNHNVPYYDIFSLPKNGEAGGVASGKEEYYSYNHGNIHFISLDSYGVEANGAGISNILSAQVTWLKQDLIANTKKWTIVYWHHPPYTKGSHNSDTEQDLIDIRTNLLPILEQYKVDLILCGHSHDYERSKLIKGHFGYNSSFSSALHNVSTSNGRYESSSSCPYVKNSPSYNGTVYVVAGSSGQLGGSELDSIKAMVISDDTHGGSLAIEVEDNRLDSKWICADGQIRDQFTIFKDVNKITNISVASGQSTTLTASWIGNYLWTGAGITSTSRSITILPTVSASYTVRDNFSCLTDVFNITVTNGRMADEQSLQSNDLSERLSMDVFPNPIDKSTLVSYQLPTAGTVTLTLYNTLENNVLNLINEIKDGGSHTYELASKAVALPSGVYLLRLSFDNKQITKRVVINK